MPATSAQDPRDDQHTDAPVPPAAGPSATAAASALAPPSVRELLAAGTAARTVSTPPDDRDAARGDVKRRE